MRKSARKMRLSTLLLTALAAVLLASVSTRTRVDAGPKPNAKKPVKLLGGILLPGNPLRFDISWVDQATGRYYLAEGGNAAVDVIDAENDIYLGRRENERRGFGHGVEVRQRPRNNSAT